MTVSMLICLNTLSILYGENIQNPLFFFFASTSFLSSFYRGGKLRFMELKQLLREFLTLLFFTLSLGTIYQG
jgi:hypothetical protein